MKIKVSKRTVDNFLRSWYIMSDNPTDWQEICQDSLSGNDKEEEMENVENFIEKLHIYAGPECTHCGTSMHFCGCENL